MDAFSAGPQSGSYGESTAFQARDYIRSLRQALDAGQISVSDFLKLGKPAAETAMQTIGQVAGRGSKAASIVNPLANEIAQYGFKQDQNGKVQVSGLPQEYQAKLREELVPTNLDPSARAAILKDLPNNVDYTSDEGRLRAEGIIQAKQLEATNQAQSTARKGAFDDLASYLADRTTRQFKQAVPGLAEDANSAGIYTGTGFSNSLANKAGELEGQNSDILAKAKQANSAADINALRDVTDRSQQFQTAGLSRTFSLDDFARNQNMQMALVNAAKVEPSGKSTGEKVAQGVQTGAAAAGAGAAVAGK